MEIRLFLQMLKDKHFTDYKKMKYKYGEAFEEFLTTLEELYYVCLPLKDFDGNDLVFIKELPSVEQKTVKLLLRSRETDYGIKAAEDEIISTSAIESIDFTRDSVRRILKGMAPKDETESRILGIKAGLDFISRRENSITEENLHKLYMMTVGDFLPEEDRLKEGHFYRHDSVFIVSDRLEHSGLDHKKLPQYMKELIAFINEQDEINDLIKAAIIHFYLAYLHPYFDGNGRIARLLHLWFLIRKGYGSALFIPFSSLIERSRKEYYDAFTEIKENVFYSKRVDVTPFLLYFTKSVYGGIGDRVDSVTLPYYEEIKKEGLITEKEDRLFKFVLSNYGADEFSTKQLEKDCGFAAYATIRGFVLKFEKLNLLSVSKYGNRVKYRIIQ